MTTEHADITDPLLHEPKGISTATSGDVYIADGIGSGDWGPYPPNLTISTSTFTSSGTWTKPAGLLWIEVFCVAAGGAGAQSASGSWPIGSNASFGSHCSTTGGNGANPSSGTVAQGGGATGGTLNFGGKNALDINYSTMGLSFGTTFFNTLNSKLTGSPLLPYYGYGGDGATSIASIAGGGAGGGSSYKIILAADLASTVAVTCPNNSGMSNGIVFVKEYKATS